MTREAGTVATIIVCERDPELLTDLCDRLLGDRFDALPAKSGPEVLRFCRYNRPDLLLLDTSLPSESGLQAVRAIRGSDGIETRYDPRLPIIAIAPRGDTERGRYVEAGADECLLRPFGYDELRAGILTRLRRRHNRHDEPVRVGELLIDPGRRKVRVADRMVQLSNKEFTLLRVLASDPTRVFSKDELLHDVWGVSTPTGRTRTLDSHASRLRRKLDPDHHRYVINCWGIGYSLIGGVAEEVGR